MGATAELGESIVTAAAQPAEGGQFHEEQSQRNGDAQFHVLQKENFHYENGYTTTRVSSVTKDTIIG